MILFNYILIYNTFYQREGRHNLGVPFFNENKNIYLKVEFNPLPVTKYHIKQTVKLALPVQGRVVWAFSEHREG